MSESSKTRIKNDDLNKVKQNVEAVNNFANRRYEGFPIGRQQPQAQPQETYQNVQNEPSAFRNEPKADYVKNDGVQTSRLQVEDNDIPPYLRKLREHR